MSAEITGSVVRRYYHGFLLGIIGLGIVGRLFHFHLTLGSDDQPYIIAARRLTGEAGIAAPSVHYARILWRSVLALWGMVPGLTLESSAVLMFTLSSASIFLVAEAGKLTFGMRAGLIAAAVYATHPLNVFYDVHTLPDGLGVALLATSLVLFLKYLQHRSVPFLLMSGLFIGLTLGVKEYFVLLAVPFAICLLCLEQNRTVKLKTISLFLACIAASMAMDFILHFWETGNPLAHWSFAASYGDRLLAVSDYAQYSGWKLMARVLADRFSYVGYLFFSFGGVAGFTAMWGLLFTAVYARRRIDCLALALSVATFFLFLSFMPVRIWPVTFVEMQDRYLTVLLPFLAVGAGAGIAAVLETMEDRALHISAVVLLIVAFAYNLAIPNDMMDRARILEFAGIRQILKSAREKQITELFLPGGYDVLTPDSYYLYGVNLKFLKVEKVTSVDEAVRTLQSKGRAVFIPRIPYRALEQFFRMGDPNVSEVGDSPILSNARELRKVLEAKNFRKEYVIVPNTSFRSWLALTGIQTKPDQLVGWLYTSNS